MSPDPHPDDLLSGWLDQELAPTEAEAVQSHLQDCVECRAEMVALETARQTMRDLDPVEAPPGFITRLVDRRRRTTRRASVLSLAAALVALGGSLALADPPAKGSPARPDADQAATDAGAKIPRLDADPDSGPRRKPGEPCDPSLLDRANEAAGDLLGLLSP